MSFDINYLINEEITERSLLVINSEGVNIGVKTIDDALKIANEERLDLVLFKPSNGSTPAIAKILDYNKFIFEQKKKEKDAKNAVSASKMKELIIKPQISDHDIEWQAQKLLQWINAGNQVKLKIKTFGRVGFKQELIEDAYNKFVKILSVSAKVQIPLKKLSPVLYEAIFVKNNKNK
ncbi:MAG: translation initiation factor IF-3 [Mycoplasmataceae bacterium]|nr:translation initiation factor IF-3 [Mycoplasmataceae bacterium]